VTLLAVVTCAALLGSITGRVTDADTGAPIAGAHITLSGPGVTAASSLMVSDDEGRFGRHELGPGRYQVSAAARGYVATSGQWRESLVLNAAATSGEVSFRLHRGAVLAGFITDDYGDPVANLTMALVEAGSPSGSIRGDVSHTTITDDRGYYRFWGLRAGRYLVSARPSAADLAAERATAATAASFYPGVQVLSRAEPVAVMAAAQVEGINFSVRAGRLSTLTIQVSDANGEAARTALVSISAADRAGAIRAFPTGAPGHFVAPQMAAGDYEIVAVNRGSGAASSYAVQPVAIAGDGSDVAIHLSTRAAARVGGQVTVGKGASPRSSAAMTVTTEPAGHDEPHFVPEANDPAGPFSGAVRGDGRFTLTSLPGRRTLRVTGMPPGWAVESITMDGRDVLDREVLLSPGDIVANVRIVVSDRLGVVTGRVTDAGVGATAVIFSRDRTRWTPGTHSMLRAPVDHQGRFRIAGVRPGDYFAAAIPREESERLLDSPFLDALATTAMSIEVRTGDAAAIVLTVAGSRP